MKKWMAIAAVALGAALASSAGDARASEFDRAMAPILAEYLKIQTALAEDETKGIKDAVETIENLAKNLDPALATGEHAEQYRTIPDDLVTACGKMRDQEDIDTIRKGFKDLSKPLSMWVSLSKPTSTSVMYCPMVGSVWVQHGSKISNPYFGLEMPGCGEKVGGAD